MHLFSIWFWLFAFFLTGLVANLITGSFSPEALWHGLVQQDPIMQQIFWELRLPRALLALSVGGLLAWAGMSMQSLFRNPLADPALIGVSAGAGAAEHLTASTDECCFSRSTGHLAATLSFVHTGWHH